MFELTPGPEEKRVRRSRRRDPVARFKPEKAAQLDAVAGCPELQVPAGHLARDVWQWVERLDTSQVEVGYSSLGRHGYHPKRVLAVWVYASLIGLHYATEVARAMRTDAAFRLLSGGHAYSEGVLKRFRQHQGALLQDALEQTVRLVLRGELVDGRAIRLVDGHHRARA